MSKVIIAYVTTMLALFICLLVMDCIGRHSSMVLCYIGVAGAIVMVIGLVFDLREGDSMKPVTCGCCGQIPGAPTTVMAQDWEIRHLRSRLDEAYKDLAATGLRARVTKLERGLEKILAAGTKEADYGETSFSYSAMVAIETLRGDRTADGEKS